MISPFLGLVLALAASPSIAQCPGGLCPVAPAAAPSPPPAIVVRGETVGPEQTIYLRDQSVFCKGRFLLAGPYKGKVRVSVDASGKPVKWPAGNFIGGKPTFEIDPDAPTRKTGAVPPSFPFPPPQANVPAAGAGGDPSGFLGWLNSVRASVGLAAVVYDPAMAADAAVNNQHQAAKGLGHHFMGSCRRQNAAAGATSVAQVGAMWLASPGHRAALLDPTIRYAAVAALGTYWTFSAR